MYFPTYKWGGGGGGEHELVAIQNDVFRFQRTKICYPVLNWLVQFEVYIYQISDKLFMLFQLIIRN